ncbi:MAG: hypothetical protein KDK70_16515 [Myxococcales bacterium]|nr:hypothetical protein [Myxococcales bacterium]
MTRAAVTMLGLTAWLAAMLGARAWWGGKAYLARILGSESLADEAWAEALARPETAVLGLDPWTLLLAVCLAVSAALVLVVLLPWDLLLRRIGVAWRVRVLAGGGLGAVAAGGVLVSIHPLLSRPSVPEGPRTVLNYACEAAGYGWVNAIAYLGAIGAGVALAWWGRAVTPTPGAGGSRRP